MHTKRLGALLALWLMILLPLPALASALDGRQVGAYLDTLGEVKQLGERMQAEGKGALLEQEIRLGVGTGFDPHQRAVMLLKREHADDYVQLNRILQPRGFTSPESWARLGDRVVLAYGAIKAESESPEILLLAQQMQGMNPQLLQLLPPEQRVQMEQALVIADALSRVSEADKQQVRPHIARLDRVFSQ